MKKLNLFLNPGGIILDETERNNAKADLAVKIISTINQDYSMDKYQQDLNDAVMSYAPNVYKYIFWKNTNNQDTYNTLYKEFTESFKRLNLPLNIHYDLDHNVKYLSHLVNIGILGEENDPLIDLLDKEDVLKYFEYYGSLNSIVYTIPDPRYIEAILDSAKVNASNSIIVGERIDMDIIPAKQAGVLKTVRLTTGIHKNQEPREPSEFPDYTIDHINKISDIIEDLLKE